MEAAGVLEQSGLLHLCRCQKGSNSKQDVQPCQGHQKQWAIPYLLQFLYQDNIKESEERDQPSEAKRRKKLKERFFAAKTVLEIKDVHALLWPGVSFPNFLPVKTGEGSTAAHMPEKTVATSILVSLCTWALTKKTNRNKTVLRAHQLLTYLVNKLASGGSWSIVLTELRFFGQHDVQLSATGTFVGSKVWGEGRCPRKERLLSSWEATLVT